MLLANLLFLVLLSIQDFETHSVPKIATVAFVILSLKIVNLTNILKAIILAAIVCAISQSMTLWPTNGKNHLQAVKKAFSIETFQIDKQFT